MPQLIGELEVEATTDASIDWGVLAIYSCESRFLILIPCFFLSYLLTQYFSYFFPCLFIIYQYLSVCLCLFILSVSLSLSNTVVRWKTNMHKNSYSLTRCRQPQMTTKAMRATTTMMMNSMNHEHTTNMHTFMTLTYITCIP